MKAVLILGSEGFIGNHLARYFVLNGFTVYGCDLFETSRHGGYNYFKVSRLSPEWEEIFTKQDFGFCINAAGSGSVSYSMTHPLLDFEANTLDTARVLDAIRRFNTSCKYLHISSAAVYGNPEKLPVEEDDRKSPLSPYGWNKLMAELVCREYSVVYGLSTAIIRPFSVFGRGLRKQLLWDICVKLQANDSINLFGTGNESRDFIHISDLTTVVDKVLMHSPFNCDVYNTATGTETSIRRIADIFEQNFPGQKRIFFSGTEKKGDPVNWRSDVSKLSKLGFAPTVRFEDGVIDYINWYRSLNNE